MCVNLEKLNSFINEEYDKVKLCLEFDLKGKFSVVTYLDKFI